MDEIITNIITTTSTSFDFTFCAIVNITTYVVIKFINEAKPTFKLTTWTKRAVFLIVSILIAIVYYIIGSDTKVLFNSILLAPVSWSWIFKPICKHLKVDYSHKDNTTNNINSTLDDIL